MGPVFATRGRASRFVGAVAEGLAAYVAVPKGKWARFDHVGEAALARGIQVHYVVTEGSVVFE